jgi:hypothetical protein
MAETPPKKSGGWTVLFTAFLFVIVIWSYWFSATLDQWNASLHSTQLERFGQIGDAFGSLNTLFSGLAIAGVVFTLYRQHADSQQAEERHRNSLEMEERVAKINALTALLSDLGTELEAIPADAKAGAGNWTAVCYDPERRANRREAAEIKAMLRTLTGLDAQVKK